MLKVQISADEKHVLWDGEYLDIPLHRLSKFKLTPWLVALDINGKREVRQVSYKRLPPTGAPAATIKQERPQSEPSRKSDLLARLVGYLVVAGLIFGMLAAIYSASVHDQGSGSGSSCADLTSQRQQAQAQYDALFDNAVDNVTPDWAVTEPILQRIDALTTKMSDKGCK